MACAMVSVSLSAGAAAIPDLAAMVALVYPISAKPPAGLSGYLVMIRQNGGRPTDPAIQVERSSQGGRGARACHQT